MPAAPITTADAKVHLRVYHTQDDLYIADLVSRVAAEWERITHWPLLPVATEQVYDAEPEDRTLRHYRHPIDLTAAASVAYTNDAGAPVTVTLAESDYRSLDSYALLYISDAQREAWRYPLTYSYTCGMTPTLALDVRSALFIRIGYLYSYRGDDPNPPDESAWMMLTARHRTGALL